MQGLKPQVAEITESRCAADRFRRELRRRVALLEGLDEVHCSACMTNACSSTRREIMLAS